MGFDVGVLGEGVGDEADGFFDCCGDVGDVMGCILADFHKSDVEMVVLHAGEQREFCKSLMAWESPHFEGSIKEADLLGGDIDVESGSFVEYLGRFCEYCFVEC